MPSPIAPVAAPALPVSGGHVQVPQTTVNATGPIVVFTNMAQVSKFHCQIQSLAKTGTSPTLDVKVQESLDGGATWTDIASATFVQFTGAAVPHVDTIVDITAVHGDQIRFFGTIGGSAGPSVDIQIDVTLVFY